MEGKREKCASLGLPAKIYQITLTSAGVFHHVFLSEVSGCNVCVSLLCVI